MWCTAIQTKSQNKPRITASRKVFAFKSQRALYTFPPTIQPCLFCDCKAFLLFLLLLSLNTQNPQPSVAVGFAFDSCDLLKCGQWDWNRVLLLIFGISEAHISTVWRLHKTTSSHHTQHPIQTPPCGRISKTFCAKMLAQFILTWLCSCLWFDYKSEHF